MLARDEDAKGQWRHTQVTRPMWFPSSRTCSACGRVNAKLKRERTWNCPNCGTRHDRNLNAAINLRNLIMPAGRSRDGRVRRQWVNSGIHGQGPCRGEPGTKSRAWKQGKTGHISGAINANLEWTWISDDRRPQAWKRDHRNLTTASNPSNLIMPPG